MRRRKRRSRRAASPFSSAAATWARAGKSAFALVLAVLTATVSALGEAESTPKCNDDAMLVFDASGSMSGNERLGIGSFVTRIDKVRKALEESLPRIAPYRRLGLITYGPGPYNRCDNIVLNLRPKADAGAQIMAAVNKLVPAGRTPLTSAVGQAADVLDYRNRPALIVLLTDGEETCGGEPCKLAKSLKAAAKGLTIHVIGYRMQGFSWTGGQGIFEVKCLAEQTGGLYIGAETVEELIAALNKALGCPMITDIRKTDATIAAGMTSRGKLAAHGRKDAGSFLERNSQKRLREISQIFYTVGIGEQGH